MVRLLIAAALTVQALPVLAQNAPPFPVKFNEVPKGEVAVVMSGDDVILSVADLEQIGLGGTMWDRVLNVARLSGGTRMVRGVEGVSLRALSPWITFTVDEENLALDITAVPQLLPRSSVVVTDARPSDIVYSRDSSSFLNYSATSGGGKTSVFGEAGVSARGNLIFSSFSRTPGSPLIRGLTNLMMDDRHHLQRRILGDAFTISEGLGSSVLIGGVTIQRSYSVDPYFVRYPSFDFRGTAATPSHVDVYVNGIRVAEQEVPPGPFDLRNLPVTAGAGNAVFVVRDAFGREQQFSENFYYSTAVLAKGLSEYAYSAGALREAYGTSSTQYGDAAVSAFHRYGFTDWLTAGGHVEATRDRWSGGPSFTFRLPAGDVDVASAVSGDHGRNGDAESLTYRYVSRRFGFAGNVRRQSREFANLSVKATDDRALLDTTFAATVSAVRASWTLQWTSTDMRNQDDRERINLYVNFPVTQRMAMFISGGSAKQGAVRQGEFFAGLNFYFGMTGANLTYTREGSHSETGIDVQKNLPVGTGYGYRLQSTSAEGDQTGSALLQYQSGFGRYEVQMDPYHTNRSPVVTASGGLVYEKGDFELTRAVQDSFALVRVPGVENVRVYSSNLLVGRTDSHGDLLVPNLLAYYGNRLRIEDKDIPMNYEVGDIEKTIAPPYRGGAYVVFPVRHIQTVTGTVVVRAGGAEQIPAFGQLTLTAKGESFVSPIGRGGEFYFENIPQQTYSALIETSTGRCEFTFTLPARSDAIVKMGKLACSTEEKHS